MDNLVAIAIAKQSEGVEVYTNETTLKRVEFDIVEQKKESVLITRKEYVEKGIGISNRVSSTSSLLSRLSSTTQKSISGGT